MKVAKGWETLWEKEKLLVMSNFSFSYSVFKIYTADTKKAGFVWERVNPFPNDKILDITKLKAFADKKLNIDKMIISLLDRVENTEGKGENAGY